MLSITFLSKGLFADGWGTANVNKKVQLALAADSIVQLNIDAGAGDLKITVADNSGNVSLRNIKTDLK